MIGIITAMPIENQLIIDSLDERNTIVHQKYSFTIGKLEEQEIVVTTCSIGKVNAAICTQILLHHFKIEFVINLGISGSLKPTYKIGDIIIGDTLFYHDVRPLQLERWFPNQSNFKSDPVLVKKFSSPTSFIANLICGNAFIESSLAIKKINAQFDSSIVDMESCAIAHACFINDTPFIAIRSVSDHADEQAAVDYEKNEQLAATTIQQFVMAQLKTINM